MAEHGKEPQAEAGGEGSPRSDSGVAALALARSAGRGGGKSDPRMDAFLDEQTDLIRLQKEHLHDERELQHRHGRLKYFGERLKVGLQLLTIMAGLAVAIALGALVWSAAHAENLVVEAFSVPPALAERGITGEALARQLNDDLAAISKIAASAEEQRGVSGDWGKSLTVEIPETGISLAEVDQWLREKLGHQSRVSGEVMASFDGRLTLAARSGSEGLPRLTGAEEDIPALIQRTAEAVYAREQPHSYVSFLDREGRLQEAADFLRPRTTLASAAERAWALNFLGTLATRTQGLDAGEVYYRRASTENPTWHVPLGNLASGEQQRGHFETAYRLYNQAIRLAGNSKAAGPAAREALWSSTNRYRLNVALQAGDFGEVRRIAEALRGRVLLGSGGVNPSSLNIARALAGVHEIAAAEAALADFNPDASALPDRSNRLGGATSIRIAAQDWAGALIAAEDEIAFAAASGPDGGDPRVRSLPTARKALALAHLGRLEEAEALIALTPPACEPCIQTMGAIAASAGKPASADHWFSEGVRIAPSLPMANTAWGRALLDRGETNKSIERLTAANRQGPRFADPIAFWGEALLAKGDAKGATAKFAEADKYAPRWGRLHLKWGQALAKLGKADEARAQLKTAAALDLTPTERAELTALKL